MEIWERERKPSSLWTIAKETQSLHLSAYDDGLEFLDLYIDNRRITYPRQIVFLWDKSDPEELEQYKDIACNQIIWFDDGTWTHTCKSWLFETEQEALAAFKDKMQGYLCIAEKIINGQEKRFLQASKFIGVVGG